MHFSAPGSGAALLTPVNEGLVRELAAGGFIANQRNVELIGGTGTGKTHLMIAIVRALIRTGTRAIRKAEVGAARTMIDRTEQRFGIRPEWLAADTAYGNAENLGWLVEERQITPFIPVIDKLERADGTWSRSDFEWDPENDQYICSEGHALKQFRRNYSDPNRGKDISGRRKFRALKSDCDACPSKHLCCPKADARCVAREKYEDAREVARANRETEADKVSRDKRKNVEMLFAHFKRIPNLTRLRLRGPNGAKDEFLLAATAQNLRKLGKLRPTSRQMEVAA